MSDPVVQAAPAGPAATEGQVQPTAAQVAQMYKVKVDGADREVSLEDLQRGYSHGTAAQERMAQASEMRDQAAAVLKIFKENPRLAFEKLGVDAKTFAQQVLSEHMEDEMLTPEQKELRRLKGFEKSHLDKVKAEEETKRKADEEKLNADTSAEMQRQIIDVLTTAGLPKNQHTVGRIAFYWDSAIRAGFTNCTPNDVIGHVKQEFQDSLRDLVGGMPDDTLLGFLGEDNVKKTVKAHMTKINAKKKQPIVPAEQQPTPSAKTEKTILSPGDFFRRGKKR